MQSMSFSRLARAVFIRWNAAFPLLLPMGTITQPDSIGKCFFSGSHVFRKPLFDCTFEKSRQANDTSKGDIVLTPSTFRKRFPAFCFFPMNKRAGHHQHRAGVKKTSPLDQRLNPRLSMKVQRNPSVGLAFLSAALALLSSDVLASTTTSVCTVEFNADGFCDDTNNNEACGRLETLADPPCYDRGTVVPFG